MTHTERQKIAVGAFETVLDNECIICYSSGNANGKVDTETKRILPRIHQGSQRKTSGDSRRICVADCERRSIQIGYQR